MYSNFLAYAAGLVVLIVIYLMLRLTGKKPSEISFILIEKIFVFLITLLVLVLIFFG